MVVVRILILILVGLYLPIRAAWVLEISQIVSVTIRETEKLKRVSYYGKSLKNPIKGLEGGIEVTVRNNGSEEISLRNLVEHGLVFTDIVTSKRKVIIHPCQCARNFSEPSSQETLKLKPGESKTFTLKEWDCSGGFWTPPEPGTYRVDYRFLPASAASPQKPSTESVKEQIAQCRRELESEEFWKEAFISAPLEIKLDPPLKKRLKLP